MKESFFYFTVYNNAIKPLIIKFPEKPIAPRTSIFGQKFIFIPLFLPSPYFFNTNLQACLPI